MVELPEVFDEDIDRKKSDLTKRVRGIDFVEAQEVFQDPNETIGPGTMKDGEERWLRIGMAKGKLWTVGYTMRRGLIRISWFDRHVLTKGKRTMAKKKALSQREKDMMRADEATTLAPGASWMKRVNVDFPVDMLRRLDEEARRVGVNRQALIKMWLNDRLEALAEKRKAS